jgi:hypothetical protein
MKTKQNWRKNKDGGSTSTVVLVQDRAMLAMISGIEAHINSKGGTFSSVNEAHYVPELKQSRHILFCLLRNEGTFCSGFEAHFAAKSRHFYI